MGVRIGAIRIVSNQRYYKLTNSDTTNVGIINAREHEIKLLKNDVTVLKTLLDSSQQQTRNFR